MAKTETMSIKEFLNGKEKQPKMKTHFKRHKKIYITAGMTIGIFILGTDVSFAADGSIDDKAEKFYWKIIKFGKWIIISKGAIDAIKATAQGDFEAAKRGFFGHLLVFSLLLIYPWAFEQVEDVFISGGSS